MTDENKQKKCFQCIKSTVTIQLREGEARFVVGVAGRNIKMIRAVARVHIMITPNDRVVISSKRKKKSMLDLARRMCISAAAGGILQWFPSYSEVFFPIRLLQREANIKECDLILRRARGGHLCLMLLARENLDDNAIRNSIQKTRRYVIGLMKSINETLWQISQTFFSK